MAEKPICKIDGCDKKVFGRGWCAGHYLRWHRHGHPLAGGVSRSHAGDPLKWITEHLHHSDDECLIWPYGRTGSGYGALWVQKKQVLAHIWVCEQIYGNRPASDMHAAHSCGNGHLGCVNGTHLRWATPKENGEDKVRHGRSLRGKNSINAKLTDEKVLAIFSKRGRITYRGAAEHFETSQGAVADIWSGRSWAWLTGAKPSV